MRAAMLVFEINYALMCARVGVYLFMASSADASPRTTPLQAGLLSFGLSRLGPLPLPFLLLLLFPLNPLLPHTLAPFYKGRLLRFCVPDPARHRATALSGGQLPLGLLKFSLCILSALRHHTARRRQKGRAGGGGEREGWSAKRSCNRDCTPPQTQSLNIYVYRSCVCAHTWVQSQSAGELVWSEAASSDISS